MPQRLKHVLIVDDTDGQAELMEQILRVSVAFPITTDIGHDGAVAVALATAHRPDVALLDIDMPVMNGIDAAHAIRQAFPECPPVLVAVTGNSIWRKRASAQGVFDHIFLKPVDIEGLVTLVDSVTAAL